MATKKPKFERVVRFITPDGVEHATYAAAEKHEKAKELAKWLDDWLEENSYHDCPSADQLAAALKAEWNISRKRRKQP